ncbi:type 2 isopentenyl-diphosphate Delta-isomerase [Weissella viridescens]|uniref:Isopentenyl-diphosphate delta-isomerase n=1 Tax=Weissella viridescens TaxID=1629 RepID=A0A3P2RCH0_WEIVI|nr:type 2 isopentenyl-diphosphate Delta-isomerase [Weissella viridescens]RRG18347.1 type 2 isopentenyl-diphosphate Delta-isomerase [Weissella viridescens]
MTESGQAHRKNEHLALAESNFRRTPPTSSLEDVRLIHRPLPEIGISDVDLTVQNPDFNWQYPFYIEAMTGGSEKTGEINQQLALAARTTGIAMAVGSESIAIKEPAQAASFQIAREVNPDGFLMANIGAGHSAENAQKAIDLIHADALEVHINAAQETVMPEGDDAFYWKDNIKAIVEQVNVPVIVKEVGFGMDAQSINELSALGVQYVNIGGRSGTNFAQIEDRRNRETPDQYAFLYDWGQTTAESLLEAQRAQDGVTIFATGGIQSPLDILKAQVMGAQTVGVAGHFLHTLLTTDVDGLIAEITRWQKQLTELYALVGAKNVTDLAQVPYILSPELKNYNDQR